MNTVTHATVTSGTANATNLVVTDIISFPTEKSVNGAFVAARCAVFFFKVVSGTVKFGRGGISAEAKGWTSSDTVIPFTCPIDELYFQAAGGSDTFVVGG